MFNEWGVVEALVVLVGLFFTIGKPINEHSKQTTRILDRLENQQSDIKHNKEELEEHNTKLQDHEMRIHDLENDK